MPAEPLPHRPLWKFHVASLCLMVLILLVHTLIMIPGHPTVIGDAYDMQQRRRCLSVVYAHGWPWVHYKVCRIEADPRSRMAINLQQANTWAASATKRVWIQRNCPAW